MLILTAIAQSIREQTQCRLALSRGKLLYTHPRDLPTASLVVIFILLFMKTEKNWQTGDNDFPSMQCTHYEKSSAHCSRRYSWLDSDALINNREEGAVGWISLGSSAW